METLSFKILFLLGFPVSLISAPDLVRALGGIQSTAEHSVLWCPLYKLTQWLCPTCGLGRSLVATWAGQYQKALEFHWLGPVCFVFFLTLWIALVFEQEEALNLRVQKVQNLLKPHWVPLIFIYGLWGLIRNLL